MPRAARDLDLTGVGVTPNERLAQRHQRIGHGDVDELALSGSLRMMESAKDARHEHRRRVQIADAWTRRHEIAGRAGVADDAAHRLRDDVVGGPVAVRALARARVAETTDGTVDELWVAGP